MYKNGITYENQKNVTTSDLQDHNVGAGIQSHGHNESEFSKLKM